MAAVSDSSPLILFARIGRLDVIHALYGDVLVPPAVQRDVAEAGHGRPGATEVLTFDWIRLTQIDDREHVLAKERSIVASARAMIDALRAAGLRLDDRVYGRLLEQACEAE